MPFNRRLAALSCVSAIVASSAAPALALPPPQDLPEEVSRTEIITAARSPVDGKPLTAAEYAELQAQIQGDPANPNVAAPARFQRIVLLLRLRKTIRLFFPFLLK